MTSQIRRSGLAPPASCRAEDDATLIRASQLEPERFAGLFRQLVVDPHDFRVLGINAIGTGWE